LKRLAVSQRQENNQAQPDGHVGAKVSMPIVGVPATVTASGRKRTLKINSTNTANCGVLLNMTKKSILVLLSVSAGTLLIGLVAYGSYVQNHPTKMKRHASHVQAVNSLRHASFPFVLTNNALTNRLPVSNP